MSDPIPSISWSDPKEVPTQNGPRLMRRASPTLEFIRYYEQNTQQMRLAGYTLNPDRYTQHLVACHWQRIPEAELKARATALEASRGTDAQIDIPCPPGREFRGYQKAGVAYILNAFQRCGAALLGDEMGLGKTPTAIGVINSEPKICRVLIICPAKLRDNWRVELSRWLTRKMSVGMVEGRCFPSAEIVISSFEMISKFPRETSYFWDLIVIDEAHRLKDGKSVRAKHIFGYRAPKGKGQNVSAIPTRRKLAMTGTPIPNKVMEIWPILRWLDPKKWDNQFQFGLRYCAGVKNKFGWSFDGGTNKDELRTILRSSVLCRRLKRDVMSELPPITNTIVELESNAYTAEREEWQKMVARMERREKQLTQFTPGDPFAAMADFLEDDFKIAFNEMSEFRHRCALAKVDPFIEDMLLQMEEIEKVVIFGHHVDCIERLMKAFAQFNPVQIIGSTKNPQAAVSRFQTDERCRMIIGNDAMMEGHTLTAASTVVFFEADWVPSKIDQKAGRCHRMGQKDNVLCIFYVLQNSLDARMIKRALQKQAVTQPVLDEPLKPMD